jgi:hypothetical protein
MYFENRERRSGTINILLNQKIHDENVMSIKKEKEKEKEKTFISQEVFTELLYKLDNIVDEKKITSKNIIFIVTNLMTVMHKYKISGEQKKQSVLFFLFLVINKSDSFPDDKKKLIFIVENIVPGAIDVLVDVYKKKYILKYSKSCFKSLCCISKKN